MACHCRTHARLRLEYDQQNRGLLSECGCNVSASGADAVARNVFDPLDTLRSFTLLLRYLPKLAENLPESHAVALRRSRSCGSPSISREMRAPLMPAETAESTISYLSHRGGGSERQKSVRITIFFPEPSFG
jgi:hypothetical protein